VGRRLGGEMKRCMDLAVYCGGRVDWVEQLLLVHLQRRGFQEV
jgi:hypothetical protein